MIRQRVLRIITEAPSVTLTQIRGQLPEVSRSRIANAITELLESRAIERMRHGCYRVAVQRPRSVAGAGQVQPLSRLMAGR